MKLSATLKLIVVTWLFCFYPLSPAWAVSSYLPSTAVDGHATTATPESPEAVREMVSRLSDKEVRDILITRLDLVAAQQDSTTTQPSLLEFTSNTLIGVVRPIKRAFVLLPQTLSAVSTLGDKIVISMQPETPGEFCLILAFSVGCALLVFYVVRRLLGPLQDKLDQRGQDVGLLQKIGVFLARFVLALVTIFAFTSVLIALLETLLSASAFAVADIIVRRVFIFAVAAYAIFDLLLASSSPHRRLLNFDDWHAKFIHRHATGVIALIGFTGAFFTFNDSNNIERSGSAAGFWINLAVYFYFIFIALRGRAGFSSLLRHPDDTPRERQVANGYPYFIVAVIVFTWLLVEALASNNQFHLIKDGRHYVFMALLIWAPAMDSAIRTVVHHIQPPVMGEGLIAERAHLSTKRSYIRIGRVVLIALVLNSVMEIWDLDIVNIASAGLGSQFVLRFIDALWIALFGYLIWELTTLWVNRKLAAEQTAAGLDLEDEEIGGEGGGAGSSRLSTVLPLLRWTAQTIIVTTTLLLVLGQLGLDTTPLLAGAGVVGLAIGFGAQKLVTDVVSGIFFLIDDAFRDGEYVEVETTVGTVEKISLRSMQLRHHRGPVHTIPYGEIPKVTNFSRDWVIMKLRFTVPFDTDLHKVKKIFKKIGQDLMEVPEFEQDLLQPFKSQGVIEVDDVGIVIRGKFMAKPGKQFTLRKEIYQRVQRAFDENGLQFARKEVRVKVDGPNTAELSEDDKQAIAAAAAESAEKPAPPPAAT